MKKITLLISGIIGGVFLLAQQKEPFMAFDSQTHNFGTIKEEDGPVTHKYIFTNTGSIPLVIKEVRASCGCTASDWTKEPVLPGNKGFVSATYNPVGRPGPFTKTVTVTSNATNSPITLRFNGTVTPRTKKPEDIYPIVLDSIRFTQNFVYFDSIYAGEVLTKKIEVWNTRKTSATLSFVNVPKHIKVTFKPSATLKPDEKGSIEFIYSAKEKNDWGYVYDNLQLAVNGQTNTNNRITVSAKIREDFRKLSPKQLENAPVLKVNEYAYDFGTVKRGEKVKHDYILTNEGKSDLIIRKKTASCGCTVAELKKNTLKPGESLPLTVEMNTENKSGEVAYTITLITNDPKNAEVILFLRGKVSQ